MLAAAAPMPAVATTRFLAHCCHRRGAPMAARRRRQLLLGFGMARVATPPPIYRRPMLPASICPALRATTLMDIPWPPPPPLASRRPTPARQGHVSRLAIAVPRLPTFRSAGCFYEPVAAPCHFSPGAAKRYAAATGVLLAGGGAI